MTFSFLFSPAMTGRRWLLAALLAAVAGAAGNLSAGPQETYGFVSTYVTPAHTWGISSAYNDTLLVSYNVFTKPEGVLYKSDRIYVAPYGTSNTLVSSDAYNLVVTGTRKNVPQIVSVLELGLQVGRPFVYQIAATKSPTAFGATGLPQTLSVDPNSGIISGVPTQLGTFTVGLAASGAGGVGQATLKITVVDPPAFFADSNYVPDDVYYLGFPGGTFFGFFTYHSYPYLYHYDLGFLYVIDAQDTARGVYFYDFASGTTWYTNPACFPYLYDFTLKTFIYYFPDAQRKGRYTTNPRYFYNLTTKQIFTK